MTELDAIRCREPNMVRVNTLTGSYLFRSSSEIIPTRKRQFMGYFIHAHSLHYLRQILCPDRLLRKPSNQYWRVFTFPSGHREFPCWYLIRFCCKHIRESGRLRTWQRKFRLGWHRRQCVGTHDTAKIRILRIHSRRTSIQSGACII